MSISEVFEAHDALGLAELVRCGEITASELVEEAIRRIDAVNPALNVVAVETFDYARKVAESTSLSAPSPVCRSC